MARGALGGEPVAGAHPSKPVPPWRIWMRDGMTGTSASARRVGGRFRFALLALAAVLGLGAAAAAPRGQVDAAESVVVHAGADATVYRSQPYKNFGSQRALAARRHGSQSFVRFDLSAVRGQRMAGFELRMTVLSGDASSLSVAQSGTRWVESRVSWVSRPTVDVTPTIRPLAASADSATFDLRPFLDGDYVTVDQLSVQVVSSSDTGWPVASRKSASAARPALVMSREPAIDLHRRQAGADADALLHTQHQPRQGTPRVRPGIPT